MALLLYLYIPASKYKSAIIVSVLEVVALRNVKGSFMPQLRLKLPHIGIRTVPKI